MASGTTRITLRLPDKLLEDLKKEADEKDLPISSLAVKILNKHTLFERRFEMTPTILLSQALFSLMIENMDKSIMEKTVRTVSVLISRLADLEDWQYEIDSVIENHFSVIGKYCGWYKFKQKINHTNYTLVFETNMGSKWEKFVSSYVKSILESLRIHITTESVNDGIIIFRFIKQ